MDLRHSLIPEDLVEEMIRSMPVHTGEGGQDDRHLPKYDYTTFMEKLMGGAQTNGRHK
jgi:hypothetical protein